MLAKCQKFCCVNCNVIFVKNVHKIPSQFTQRMSKSMQNLYKECPRRPYAISINDSNYSCWLQTAEGLVRSQAGLFEFWVQKMRLE